MAAVDPRHALRQAIALEHVLHQEREKHDRLAARWQHRAELALRRGHEELAHEALARKAAEDRLAGEYRAQYLAQANAINQAKRRLKQASPIPPQRERAGVREPGAGLSERVDQLAREDRLERDLAALKAQLAGPTAAREPAAGAHSES